MAVGTTNEVDTDGMIAKRVGRPKQEALYITSNCSPFVLLDIFS